MMRATSFPKWARATVDNPVAFFYLFRFFTWILAVIVYLTQSAPPENLRFGLGLALYTLLHLVLGTAYAIADGRFGLPIQSVDATLCRHTIA